MDINEFKKKNNPKKTSSLTKYKDDILNLLNSNFSHLSITKYLKLNGVKTTRQNVSKYIKKILNKESITQTTKTKKQKNKDEVEPKKSNFANIDFNKKVGKSTEIQKVDWT